MTAFRMRRIATTLALLLGVVGALVASPASAAAADPRITYSVDKPVVRPGETFTVSMALRNTETTGVVFAYQYIEANYPLNTWSGIIEVIDCGGDIADCSHTAKSATFHPRVPIAPGDSRTVTLTVRALPATGTSPAPGVTQPVNWNPYYYYEYDYTPGKPSPYQHGGGPLNWPSPAGNEILY
ncbi:hypothetical protein ACFRMQ_02020 [Kitasatospora sp. NPDC056783]|uniref:hypothetical protein n=1 Tax=Kitasatospora sp. NPDC056783 TaxID=3345943 RepID=UPI0036CA8B79